MTKSGVAKDERDTPMRRVRHRDGKLLRGGIGLTTGLGWSDRCVGFFFFVRCGLFVRSLEGVVRSLEFFAPWNFLFGLLFSFGGAPGCCQPNSAGRWNLLEVFVLSLERFRLLFSFHGVQSCG